MATEGFTFEQVVSLEGELLVEDSIKIKQMLGSDAFIFRYSNDVMNYIPSSTVFKEGGYERDPVSMIYGLPAKQHPTVETRILQEVVKLAEQAGVLKTEN